MTITFVMSYQLAMPKVRKTHTRFLPALLFILPMELLCVLIAAYAKYGVPGIAELIKFDEERALKTGQVMLDSS